MEFSKNFIAGRFQRIEQMNWKILELSERTRNDHELITNLIFTFNKISLKFNTISPSKLEGMIKILEESVKSRLRGLKELEILADTDNSMTQLFSHTIAHFTWPSFMIKANNQPCKNCLGLVYS